jgi:hydrogenase maturation protease
MGGRATPRAIVIGYGSPLRGDDGVGPRVAEAIARRRPDVRALAVHQLTPELAAEVAAVDVAVFVDARLGGEAGVRVTRVEPSAAASSLGHVAMPGDVLALARALYDRSPVAFAVAVPVSTLAFGDRLSRAARAAARTAVRAVLRLLPPPGGRRGA